MKASVLLLDLHLLHQRCVIELFATLGGKTAINHRFFYGCGATEHQSEPGFICIICIKRDCLFIAHVVAVHETSLKGESRSGERTRVLSMGIFREKLARNPTLLLPFALGKFGDMLVFF